MRGFSDLQIASFAAACATRTSPIIDAFSGRDEYDRVDEWLDELWSLVASPDRHIASDLAARVGAAPLARVDDSNRPEFYAMRAMSVLAYAVQVQLEDDPLKAVLWCSRAAVGLLRDLDVIVGAHAGSAGSLGDLEMVTEQAWIGSLSDRGASGAIARGCEDAMASDVFRRLPEVCTQVARAREWVIGDPGRSGDTGFA
jgi:hypothetical protein